MPTGQAPASWGLPLLTWLGGDFLEAFAYRGAPATSPGVLALVSVLQYAERLTDRQAAGAVRSAAGRG